MTVAGDGRRLVMRPMMFLLATADAPVRRQNEPIVARTPSEVNEFHCGDVRFLLVDEHDGDDHRPPIWLV